MYRIRTVSCSSRGYISLNPVPDLTPSFPSRKKHMLGPDPYLPQNVFLGVSISQCVKVWIREALRPSLIKPYY
jgi:hypothetical protein